MTGCCRRRSGWSGWIGMALIGVLAAVGAAAETAPPVKPAETAAAERRIDYALAENWVRRPAEIRYPVDVFYLTPTIFVERGASPYLDWSIPALHRRMSGNVKRNTGVFAAFANVYAPFYRQLGFRSILAAMRRGETAALALPEADARAAFRYYMEHENGGRPFFLFGHSQGAMLLLELLKRDFAEHPQWRDKMIAAYLPGCPMTTAELRRHPHLRFARGATDCGVLITYQTQAPGAKNPFFVQAGGLGINPLNWRRDATAAGPEENLGSVLFDRDDEIAGELRGRVGALLDPATGALLVEPPEPGTYEIAELGAGVYHAGDISLFFRNLEANAKARAAAYRSAAAAAGKNGGR